MHSLNYTLFPYILGHRPEVEVAQRHLLWWQHEAGWSYRQLLCHEERHPYQYRLASFFFGIICSIVNLHLR